MKADANPMHSAHEAPRCTARAEQTLYKAYLATRQFHPSMKSSGAKLQVARWLAQLQVSAASTS